MRLLAARIFVISLCFLACQVGQAQTPVDRPVIVSDRFQNTEVPSGSTTGEPAVSLAKPRNPDTKDQNQPQEFSGDERTESLMDLKIDDQSTKLDEIKAGTPADRLPERMQQLKKPMASISLASANHLPTPPNQAFRQLNPEIVVTSLNIEANGLNRYTITHSHRPLYFEQPNLERCGESYGFFTNAVSGVKFLGDVFVLPYKIGRQRPDCTVQGGTDCRACQQLRIDGTDATCNRRGVAYEFVTIAVVSLLFL